MSIYVCRTPLVSWTLKCTVASFSMVDSLPLSIELSPVQREILDLIIQDQASIHGPVEPERVILLWSEGASESITAEKLGISEEEVKTLRNRWWAWTARIADAEKKLNTAFNDHVSLIFRIQTKSPLQRPHQTLRQAAIKPVAPTKGTQRNRKNYDLRPERSSKSFTTTQRSTGSKEQLDPRKPRCGV